MSKLCKLIPLVIVFPIFQGCTASFLGTWEFQSGNSVITCTIDGVTDSDTEDATGEEFDIVASAGPTPIRMLPDGDEDCPINLTEHDHVAVSASGQTCDFRPDDTAFDFAQIDVIVALTGTSGTGSAAFVFSGPVNDPPGGVGNCTVSIIGPIQKTASP